MNTGLIARRYAKALMAYATERGQTELLYRQMGSLAGSFEALPALRTTLVSPVVSREEKMSLVCAAVGAEPAESFRDFVRLVLDNRREAYLRTMALEYMSLYRKSNNISVVHLTSATELDKEVTGRIAASVVAKTQGAVELDCRIDPSLGGGFIFRIDDKQLDASVRGALERIAKAFKQTSVSTL